MKFKILIITTILLIFAFSKASSVNAQTLDVGIYPPIIQAQTVPPADVKVPLYIQNFSGESVNLDISLKSFQSSDNENGEVSFIQNPQYADPYIAQRIIVLDGTRQISSITLSPKQVKNLTVEFKIPQNEPKGDYYFSLIFSSTNNNQNKSTFTQAEGGVAANILLTVGPLGKTSGVLEDFSAQRFALKGPIPFNIRLRNTSDHYISPSGDILITNMFGQTIGKVTLLQVNVLSNSVRRLPDKIQSGNNPDFDKIKSIVEQNKYPVAVWPESFLLGPYKADLTISLSDNGPVFKRTIWFFAFPGEYLLAILAIIGIVVYVVLRVKKKIA